MSDEAVIIDAGVGAAHDGEAELVLQLRYPNGVVAPVILDAEVGFALMKSCGVDRMDDLAGHSWKKILEGL